VGFEAEAEVLAGRGTRLQAWLVDVLAMSALILALSIANAAARDEGEATGVIVLGLLAVGLGVYQVVLLGKEGQTIGKRWMGIKIVKLDGQPVGFVSAVLVRTVSGQIVLGFIPFYGVIDLLMIFGADRHCLHDMIATTQVVRVT
jgi:uncharacterized RDD family membrane protein YckC